MGKRGNGEGSIYQRTITRTLKHGTVKSTPVWCAAVSLDGGKRKILYGKTGLDPLRWTVCLGCQGSGAVVGFKVGRASIVQRRVAA